MADRLFGFFPKGAAGDPEIFATGVIRLLAAYPHSVVEAILSPLSGLPSKHTFLPSIAELKAELESQMGPIRRAQERQQAWATSSSMLGPPPEKTRPSLDELRERYGSDWGIDQVKDDRRWRPMSIDQLKSAGGLSDAQWDALPDAPLPPGMQKLPGLHVVLEMAPKQGES